MRRSVASIVIATVASILVLVAAVSAVVTTFFFKPPRPSNESPRRSSESPVPSRKRRLLAADVASWVQVLLSIVALAISLKALNVAVEAYNDAKTSSVRQEIALESARRALLSVAGAVSEQRQYLDVSAKKITQVASVVQQQRDEEVRRAARHPVLEISLGQVPPQRLLKPEPIAVMAENNGISFGFAVKNTGDAPLMDPVFRVIAIPDSVAIAQPGMLVPADTHQKNVYSMFGINAVKQLNPARMVGGGGYAFGFDALLPPDLSDFQIIFSVAGSNAPTETRKIALRVVRKPPP